MSDAVRPQRRQPTRLPRPWDSPGENTGVGCHFLLQCMKVKSESQVSQSCLTPPIGFSREEYWIGDGVIPFLHFNLLVQNNLKDVKVIFQMNFNVILSIMTLKFYSSICHFLMIMLVKYFLIGNFFLIVSVQTYVYLPIVQCKITF